jgi:predicted ester cyclase
MSTDPRELYRRWLLELWTSGEQALAEQLVTADFVGHWPDQDVHGPGELAAVIGQSLSFFQDVTTSIEVGPLVDGDLVAARWAFSGPYAGGMPGASVAAGTEVTLRGADVMRVAGGRFAEYWVSSDTAQFAAQLGVATG